MKNLYFLIILATNVAYAQGYFTLPNDLNDESVSYRDTVLADSIYLRAMFGTQDWAKDIGLDLKFRNQDSLGVNFIYTFNAQGKQSEYGKDFDYRFTAIVNLHNVGNGFEIIISDFVKKSSPGEPGMSLEAYIENYKPKISSTQTRFKSEMRLDEIEMTIDERVHDLLNWFRKAEQN